MAEIFIQHADGTVESIPVTPGSTPDRVVLARAPKAPLSLLDENYAKATFVIVDSSGAPKCYLVVEKTPQGNFTSKLTAINYDPRFYGNDGDNPVEDTWPWWDEEPMTAEPKTAKVMVLDDLCNVYFSSDNGLTFTLRANLAEGESQPSVWDGATTSLVWAGGTNWCALITRYGFSPSVYHSDDDGLTWTRTLDSPPNDELLCLMADPATTMVVALPLRTINIYPFVSVDGGRTFYAKNMIPHDWSSSPNGVYRVNGKLWISGGQEIDGSRSCAISVSNDWVTYGSYPNRMILDPDSSGTGTMAGDGVGGVAFANWDRNEIYYVHAGMEGNGATLQATSYNTDPDGWIQPHSVFRSGNYWIAIGYYGACYSPNGVDWTIHLLPTGLLQYDMTMPYMAPMSSLGAGKAFLAGGGLDGKGVIYDAPAGTFSPVDICAPGRELLAVATSFAPTYTPVDDGGDPEPPPEGELTVWAVDGMTMVSKTAAAELLAPVNVYAAKGEYEPFQVVVKGLTGGLTHVTVTVSNLTGPSTISSSNLEVFLERYVTITTPSPDPGGTNHPLGAGTYPDGLIPLNGGSFPVAANTNQPVWIDLFVPRGTPAGTYTGTITVTADQGVTEVPVNLTVWNFELPVKPSLKSSFSIQTPALTDSAWQQMLIDHKLMPTWLTGAEATSLMSRGLNEASMWYWSNQNACTIDAAPSTSSFITSAASYPSNLEVNVYVADEPYWKCQTPSVISPQLVAWARNIHASRAKVLITVEPRSELMDDGTGRSAVDIWVPLCKYFNAASSYMTTARARGDEIWLYQTLVQDNYAPKWLIDYAPVNHRILHGFISASLDIHGNLYWAVNAWDGYAAGNPNGRVDPWTFPVFYDGTKPCPGDGMLMYPGESMGVSGPVPTMRLKWIRKGVEDYEYVQMLKAYGGTQAAYAYQISRSVGQDLHTWSQDANEVSNARKLLGERLHSLNP